jgi:hypothetical protein
LRNAATKAPQALTTISARKLWACFSATLFCKSDRLVEAVGLFISDTIACLDRTD